MDRPHTIAVGLLLLLNSLLLGGIEGHGLTADQSIEEAHKYDNMWASDQEADQKKALGYYSAALSSGPDERQRLHILYRMAQLYGSAYQLEKGEKPDFHKAIELNREIVDSYPLTEPLVSKALLSLGDHHVTLRQFDRALEYFQRILDYDIGELERLRHKSENEEGRRLLEENIERIKQFQKIAVDQVGYCANLIHPLCVHEALRNIATTHRQAFIRDYAAEKMASTTDPLAELWTPALPVRNEALSAEQPGAPRKYLRADSADKRDTQVSPANPVVAHTGAAPLKAKLLWYVIAGLSAVGVLGLAQIVITRKHHWTLTGKDAP